MKYDAKKLRDARLKKRLTRTEVARRAGLSVESVSRIEKGKAPWLKAIREIEAVLGIDDAIKTESA